MARLPRCFQGVTSFKQFPTTAHHFTRCHLEMAARDSIWLWSLFCTDQGQSLTKTQRDKRQQKSKAWWPGLGGSTTHQLKPWGLGGLGINFHAASKDHGVTCNRPGTALRWETSCMCPHGPYPAPGWRSHQPCPHHHCRGSIQQCISHTWRSSWLHLPREVCKPKAFQPFFFFFKFLLFKN